jgi:hypothetical protein
LRAEVERAAAARKGASEVVGLAVQLTGLSASRIVQAMEWKQVGRKGGSCSGKWEVGSRTHLAGPATRLSLLKTASCGVYAEKRA